MLKMGPSSFNINVVKWLSRNKMDHFLDRLVTWDEKWITYDNFSLLEGKMSVVYWRLTIMKYSLGIFFLYYTMS